MKEKTDSEILEQLSQDQDIEVSVKFSGFEDEYEHYYVAITQTYLTKYKDRVNRRTSNITTVRLPKKDIQDSDYWRLWCLQTCMIDRSYECMLVNDDINNNDDNDDNDEFNKKIKKQIKYQEKYRKWPRTTDNWTQLVSFVFNASVAAVKVFLDGNVITALGYVTGGFSIISGITGIFRSGNGIRKANKNIDVLNDYIEIIEKFFEDDNSESDFPFHQNALKRLKYMRNIEINERRKHCLRLIIDIFLVVVGILTMLYPAYALYTMSVSVALIASFSLISWYAMKRKREIAQQIFNIRDGDTANLVGNINDDHLNDNLEFVKQGDTKYKEKRNRRFNNYSWEFFSRIALALITIAIGLITLVFHFYSLPLMIILVVCSGIASFITSCVKVWFTLKTSEIGNERNEIVTQTPNDLRAYIKIIAPPEGKDNTNSNQKTNGDHKKSDSIHDAQENQIDNTVYAPVSKDDQGKTLSMETFLGGLSKALKIYTEKRLIQVIRKGEGEPPLIIYSADGKRLKHSLKLFDKHKIQFEFDSEKSGSKDNRPGEKIMYTAKYPQGVKHTRALSQIGIFRSPSQKALGPEKTLHDRPEKTLHDQLKDGQQTLNAV